MIYNISNIDDVKKVISLISTSESQIRKNDAFNDYQIYSGGQMDLLIKKLKQEFPDSFSEMRPIEFNYCKKVVNKRASLYKDGIERIVMVNGEKNDDMQVIFDNVYKIADIDNIMKKANALFELNSFTKIQILLDENNNIKARSLPLYLFDDLPNILGQQEIVILTHYIDSETMRLEATRMMQGEKFYTVWTKDHNVVIKETTTIENSEYVKRYEYVVLEGNENNENPIKKLPFVNIKQNTDGFYYPFRNGIATQAFIICLILSDVTSISRSQGYGQAVMIAPQAVMPENVKCGIKTIIKIPIPSGEAASASFQYVTSNAPISEQMATIRELVLSYLNTNDLVAEEASQMQGTNALNGISKLIESAKLSDALDNPRSIFIKAERDLFDLLVAWLDLLYDSNQLPDDYKGYKKVDKLELRVKFLESKPLLGEEDKLNMIQKKLDLGLIESWEKHKIMNPDLTIDEAKAKELAIQADKTDEMQKNIQKINMPMMEQANNAE